MFYLFNGVLIGQWCKIVRIVFQFGLVAFSNFSKPLARKFRPRSSFRVFSDRIVFVKFISLTFGNLFCAPLTGLMAKGQTFLLKLFSARQRMKVLWCFWTHPGCDTKCKKLCHFYTQLLQIKPNPLSFLRRRGSFSKTTHGVISPFSSRSCCKFLGWRSASHFVTATTLSLKVIVVKKWNW